MILLFGIFGNTSDQEFEKNISIFKGTLTESMRTYHLRMTLKVNVFTDDVSEHVRRTGIPLGPSSEQELDSQHKIFGVFYRKIRAPYTKSRGLYYYSIILVICN